MKKISDRLSYSKRIFIVFALLCSVSIFLVAGTYYVRLYADNRKLAQNEFKDISTRTAQALEREIDMMDMISCQIFGNKKIQKELFDATENRKKESIISNRIRMPEIMFRKHCGVLIPHVKWLQIYLLFIRICL